MQRCWIISLPLPERTFNTSVYLTFQNSNLLWEKNKITLTYPQSKLCGKEEICLLPFGGKDWGSWLRTRWREDLKTLERDDNKTMTTNLYLLFMHWSSLADYLSIRVAHLPNWVVSSFQLQHLAKSFSLH